jgi:hypothetical protein
MAAGYTAYCVALLPTTRRGAARRSKACGPSGVGSVGTFTPTATGAGSRLCYSAGLPCVLQPALTLTPARQRACSS